MQSRTRIFVTVQIRNVHIFVLRKILWRWVWLSVHVGNSIVSSVYRNLMNLLVAGMCRDGGSCWILKRGIRSGLRIIRGNVQNAINLLRRKWVVRIWNVFVGVSSVMSVTRVGMRLIGRWNMSVLIGRIWRLRRKWMIRLFNLMKRSIKWWGRRINMRYLWDCARLWWRRERRKRLCWIRLFQWRRRWCVLGWP